MAEQPKYLQVAEILRREIAAGVFQDGQTLMTEEELRLRFNVSRQTVRQAISLLEDDGLVDRRRGSGTYVRHGPRKRQGVVRVGVVTTYITDYIFPNIVSGIESALNGYGAVMSLSATYNDQARERSILQQMISGQVDGVIVEGVRAAESTPNADLYMRLAERNIPVLFMNSYYPELNHIPYVVMDDYGGGQIAAREMIARGYRRPAGMFKTDDLTGRERARGFLDELKSHGADVPPERLLYFGTEQRMTLYGDPEGLAFMNMLAAGKADCVICYNDVFAGVLMQHLRERGMSLPGDLGVMGFDDANLMMEIKPALTTLAHPKEAFGTMVAEKMMRMIAGEKESSVRVPWKLVERESLPEKKG